jgi:hypothetical protein
MSPRRWIAAGVAVGALLAGAGTLHAQAPADCPKGALEKIEGQVVKVDANQGTLTVRSADGSTHDFQVSKETLQDMKVGDKIEAKLRISEKCRKG